MFIDLEYEFYNIRTDENEITNICIDVSEYDDSEIHLWELYSINGYGREDKTFKLREMVFTNHLFLEGYTKPYKKIEDDLYDQVFG